MIVCNVIMLCISIFCTVRTHNNNERLNQAERDYTSIEQDGEVELTFGGECVRMVFGSSAVRIYDAYRHTGFLYEILLFVREYAEKHGYEIQRKNTELIGEYKLHTVLYRIGYKRERTGDLDWDYVKDERWYVNVVSSVIGWCGL